MRRAIVIVIVALVASSAVPAGAQQRRTERVTVRFRVVEMLDPGVDFLCGIFINYASYRVRVLAVEAGRWDHPQMWINVESCGATEQLMAWYVGKRFRATLERSVTARELRLPLARQPAFYARPGHGHLRRLRHRRGGAAR